MYKTKNLNDGYMGSGKYIKRAIEKYGMENFIKEILHIFDNEEDMKDKEKELVVLSEMSYNLCPGGKGGFGYINKTRNHKEHSQKSSKKISDTIKKHWKEGKYDNKRQIWILKNKTEKKKTNFSLDKNLQIKANKLSQTLEAIEKRKNTLKKIGHQQGEKNSCFGTIWITNGYENKKMKKDDIIPEGWYKGRINGTVAQKEEAIRLDRM